MRPVWAEIDLSAVAYNCKRVRQILNPKTQIMAVIKANAYGHGAIPVAKKALEAGATWLGVSSQEEALEIREEGITAPILILGFTPPEDAPLTIKQDITQTIFSLEQGLALNEAAKVVGKKAQVHLKIDTGMGRIGFNPNQVGVETIKKLSQLPFLVIQGVFTHLADAGNPNKAFANKQMALFHDFMERLKIEGIKIPLKHAANSAAILSLPETQLDLVRTGILLYGLCPFSKEQIKEKKFKPVLSLKAKIIHLKEVETGTPISYGGTYIAKRPSLIGTLPLGYADGVARILSNQGQVLVKGKRAPIVGNICMDQLMIDVTDINGVTIGDEVVLIGSQGREAITSDELADKLGTINYEIVASINSRVRRIYLS